jgi:hypothetical protein
MPECRIVRYRNKCTPVRYRNATVGTRLRCWMPEYRRRRHRPRCRCPPIWWNVCNPKHCFNLLVAIGYGIYGVGMTMCMLKIFYWSQLHHVLGPLSISIKKVKILLYFYSIKHFLTARELLNKTTPKGWISLNTSIYNSFSASSTSIEDHKGCRSDS